MSEETSGKAIIERDRLQGHLDLIVKSKQKEIKEMSDTLNTAMMDSVINGVSYVKLSFNGSDIVADIIKKEDIFK